MSCVGTIYTKALNIFHNIYESEPINLIVNKLKGVFFSIVKQEGAGICGVGFW